MPVRARTAATSLRSRLTFALAVLLIGPVLVGAVAAGVLGPRAARIAAQHAAGHDADSAVLALAADCETVRAAATATAGEVQAYATKYGTLSATDAVIAARRAAARRPDLTVAVFDARSQLIALAGSPAGRGPASVGGYGASCAAGTIGTAGATLPSGTTGAVPSVAGLAERLPVLTMAAGRVGWVVFWMPLDDAALATLRAGLGTDGQLSVLAPGGNSWVMATSAPAGQRARLGTLAARATAQVPLTSASTAGGGSRAGRAGTLHGQAYAVREPRSGVPVRVLATAPVRRGGLWATLGLIALVLSALALLPVRLLAGRLSSPLTEELRSTSSELRFSQVALADTFDQFSAVLQNTHNLERLLVTITAACLNGTGAVAGLTLLADPDDDQPGARVGSQGGVRDGDQPGPRVGTRVDAADGELEAGRELHVLGRAFTGGPAGERGLAELPGFAERYFRELDVDSQPLNSEAPLEPPEPLFWLLPGAGPAVAVPIRNGGRVLGVLALARGEGAPAFDALALPRMRELAAHAGTAIQNVRLHEEARRLSVTDALTGVGNVRQLSGMLSREIAAAIRFERPLTVLMLDLDHFKRVNDTFGHAFGDLVLREFAHRLQACVREVDMVARYGGEEFAVVLPETDAEGGGRVAERVLNAVRAEPFRRGELRYPVTVSIGIAQFPPHGRSTAELLQAADEALYGAKRHGRDRWEIAGISPSASAVSQAG